MNFHQKMEAQLDKDFPNWYYDWATPNELREATDDLMRTQSIERMKAVLRYRVSLRLIQPILNAALEIGAVALLGE